MATTRQLFVLLFISTLWNKPATNAEVVEFPINGDDSIQWQLNGNADLSPAPALVLNSDCPRRNCRFASGSVFTADPIDIQTGPTNISFDATFQFIMRPSSAASGSGDGCALVVQAADPELVGGTGSNLGYTTRNSSQASIGRSLAILFRQTDGPCIEVRTSSSRSFGCNTDGLYVRRLNQTIVGQDITARVTYSTGVISLYFKSRGAPDPVFLVRSVRLESVIGLDAPFFGVTAATSAKTAVTDVKSVNVYAGTDERPALSSNECPVTDICDFEFAEGFAILNLTVGGDRRHNFTVVTKDGSAIKVVNTNGGCRAMPGFLSPCGNVFYFQNNQLMTRTLVANDLPVYSNKCVLLDVTEVQFPDGTNLRDKKYETKYPVDRRCILFSTGAMPTKPGGKCLPSSAELCDFKFQGGVIPVLPLVAQGDNRYPFNIIDKDGKLISVANTNGKCIPGGGFLTDCNNQFYFQGHNVMTRTFQANRNVSGFRNVCVRLTITSVQLSDGTNLNSNSYTAKYPLPRRCIVFSTA